ncbi:hypothetical protein [uncultured Nocardioides sp.]|uniref:hypothetical protein n=1 Tax=uncultured Nocardioides sp. TaxID=198441 RepID=UPI00261C1F08|nr:hypothetical protein [uncultured Nocardioides sp.]
MSENKPRKPAGLGSAASRLWSSVVDEYELDEHELALLVEAVRTVEVLAKLDERVRCDGPLVTTPQGERAHPALVEARQQRIALARLLAALRMPSGDGGENRPQRRVGARGVYKLRPAS